MSNWKKIILFLVLTSVALVAIEKFVFASPWACFCFDEEIVWKQCETTCGKGKCNGFNHYSWGVCSFGNCVVNGFIMCKTTGYKSIVFMVPCQDCKPNEF